MVYCVLQICCLLLFVYVYINSRIQTKNMKLQGSSQFFIAIVICAVVEFIFDGLSAYTVNNLDSVPKWLNQWAHFLFLTSIDAVVFLVFCYLLQMVDCFPKSMKGKVVLYSPLVVNFFLLLTNMEYLRYVPGELSYHCEGTSANACYAMATLYAIFSLVVFLRKLKFIEKQKQASIALYGISLLIIVVVKFIYPDFLITASGVTILVCGIFLTNENPVIQDLYHYQDEMVMGFATLVENRDNNTGGHIKRTSLYAERIAVEMQRRNVYGEVMTKDFVNNLRMAAPMHDIGKIAIPDAILQKPGRLTQEEIDIMKTHAAKGGEIIRRTFANVSSPEYTRVCYEVAMHHHEKWNGQGYPLGLRGESIPLSARIMAVADVFDALSEKRCYKEPLPLDACFEIIKNKSGEDFDPQIVELFLSIKNDIMDIHANCMKSIEDKIKKIS